MSKLNPGVRVFVIDENHEMKKGVIKAVHESVSIAIVIFDDGNVEKVEVDSLGICREEPTKEEPNEPVENGNSKILPDDNYEVTITYGQFRDLSVNCAMKMGDTPFDVFKLTAYGAKLAHLLFSDKK